MALPPIKLRLDGEEIHLVSSRELERRGGFLNGRRGAWKLVTPDNVGVIRRALMCPAHVSTEGVFTELRKQLEDGTALFFEVPPPAVAWDAPPIIDIHELLPTGGDETYGPGGGDPARGLHWIEVVCISARGESYAGARARVRLPDGRSEYVTLDARSSVRFDDLSEGGTAHFELSGEAVARGTIGPLPAAQHYELGGSLGLSTQRRHVLEVHPNPRAFVSVELFVGDEPVVGGQYTLTTQHGEMAGALEGEVVRDEGFVLPSESTYSFEGVILPPRPAEDDSATWVAVEVVHRRDGTPLLGRLIRVTRASGAVQHAATGIDGRVRFEGLEAGESVKATLFREVVPDGAPGPTLDDVAVPEDGEQPEEDLGETGPADDEPAPVELDEVADDEDLGTPPVDDAPPDFDALDPAADDEEETDDDDLEEEDK